MPAYHATYNLVINLKISAKAEAVNNNSKITR